MVIQSTLNRSDKGVIGGNRPPRRNHAMTTIRTSCPLCGDVELAPADLSLRLAPCRGTGTYHFRCPHCEELRQRPASHRVVSILLATGVVYEVVDDGAPITEAEIRTFLAGLDQADWQEYLIS
jgi:hypothetical protein